MTRTEKIKKIRNNRGSSMVETIVSFVVLIVIFLVLTQMVNFSSRLRMRAADTADVRSKFNQEIFKKGGPVNDVEEYEYYGKSVGNMTMFTIKLDTEATDVEKNVNSANNFYLNSIRLTNIDAFGYVSTDPRIAEESLATPKAVIFKYHEHIKQSESGDGEGGN